MREELAPSFYGMIPSDLPEKNWEMWLLKAAGLGNPAKAAGLGNPERPSLGQVSVKWKHKKCPQGEGSEEAPAEVRNGEIALSL